MQKALVVGSTGLLGSRISRMLSEQYEVTCTHHKNSPLPGFESINLDITSFSEIENFLAISDFDLVINSAGLTSVEACESRPEAAWQLNATLPYHLALLSDKYGARFIHISTDHYQSELESPRDELATMLPINQYGYSKFAGERFVLNFNTSATVIRTNFFGLSLNGSHSLLDFLVSKLSNDQEIVGFKDVQFSPLGAMTLVSLITEIAKQSFPGLINAAGSETISKLEFARLVAKSINGNPALVSPGSVSNLGGSVPRPNYLALDGSKLASSLKIQLPSIESMLKVELQDAI
ncbi:RfbD dTDP-4-dehydrorhamnose reductase [Candidatus Nanopelagicaceae bacterium]